RRFSLSGGESDMTNTCSLLGAVVLFATTTVQGAVSFDQVQTILKASCVNCHKGEKPQGGLRLDTPEGIARAVVPGKSADSQIFQRITANDDRRRMPPGGPGLQPEGITTLRSWIDAGAVLPKASAHSGESSSDKHWAYRKPVKPSPPEVKAASLIRNPI